MDQASAPVFRPSTPEATGGTEVVLIVEDDPQVRLVTVRTLRDAGYEVIGLSHPQQALELPSDVLRRLHLLVTDVVMPGLDGRALAEEMCPLVELYAARRVP